MEMIDVRQPGMDEEIRDCISSFFAEQMGEHYSSVQTFFHNQMVIIIAKDCLTSCELAIADNDVHYTQLLEYKARQFDQAKSILKQTLEMKMQSKIENIESIIERHGVRYFFVTIVDNSKKYDERI